MISILKTCHSSPVGGHHSGFETTHKILQYGCYCSTINNNAHDFAKSCDHFQREGGISKR